VRHPTRAEKDVPRFIDNIVISDGEQFAGIYIRSSDDTFSLASELNVGEFVGGLTVGDFNGDGHIDVAAGG
jgi:hypothetical protein